MTCFSTPSHKDDVDFLIDNGVEWLKIGSDDALNFPLIEYCASRCSKLFVSTGMSTFEELMKIGCFLNTLKCETVMLHCITSYPAVEEDLNLNVIKTLVNLFPNLEIGYSDHFPGNEACLFAYSHGAQWLEKHVIPSTDFIGVDSAVGQCPVEISELQKALDSIHRMSGSTLRGLGKQEKINRLNNRKSLHFLKDMKAGDVLLEGDIIALRPGTGIPPCDVNKLIGLKLKSSVDKNKIVSYKDFYDE